MLVIVLATLTGCAPQAPSHTVTPTGHLALTVINRSQCETRVTAHQKRVRLETVSVMPGRPELRVVPLKSGTDRVTLIAKREGCDGGNTRTLGVLDPSTHSVKVEIAPILALSRLSAVQR